jgi:hypothetical protein
MVVIVIIAIISLLTYPAFQWYRVRAQKIACQQNLKSLYVATSTYVNANGDRWPQIMFNSEKEAEYADSWMEALGQFGISWGNFICPVVQIGLKNPNYLEPSKHRTDYMGGVFVDQPGSCRKWPKQPWFVERQDSHGSGNLMILTDGSLLDLNQAQELGGQPQ